tara:strand:- start:1769 stop:1966 length:198 start_codon:yes stop_codon:yes gene_type:complete
MKCFHCDKLMITINDTSKYTEWFCDWCKSKKARYKTDKERMERIENEEKKEAILKQKKLLDMFGS